MRDLLRELNVYADGKIKRKAVSFSGGSIRVSDNAAADVYKRQAAAYLSAHPDVICIVSGGQGPGEKITEAACMRRLLLDAGIPGTRIWLEPKASDTAENLANSLALIERCV